MKTKLKKIMIFIMFLTLIGGNVMADLGKMVEERDRKYQEYREIADKFNKSTENYDVSVDWKKDKGYWEVYISEKVKGDFYSTTDSIRMPFNEWARVAEIIGELLSQEVTNEHR